MFRFGTKLLDTYGHLGCRFCIYLYFYLIHQRVSAFIQARAGCRPESVAHSAVWLYLALAVICMHTSMQIYGGYSLNEKWDALAQNQELVLLIRLDFGAFFYYLGSCFAMLRRSRDILTPWLFVTLLVSVAVCRICYYLTDGRPDFSMQIMHFPYPVTPFVISLTGIGMLYAAAALLARVRAVAGPLAVLGRRSFSVMSHHIFAFLLLNLCRMALGLTTKKQLVDPYFKWKEHYTHLVYLLAGLAYPLLFFWLPGKTGGMPARRNNPRNLEKEAF